MRLFKAAKDVVAYPILARREAPDRLRWGSSVGAESPPGLRPTCRWAQRMSGPWGTANLGDPVDRSFCRFEKHHGNSWRTGPQRDLPFACHPTNQQDFCCGWGF